MRKGRPPRIEPKTAFDFRRYLTLVQALALPEKERWVKHLLDPRSGEENLLTLCELWGVEPVIVYPMDGRRAYYNMGATLHKLAQHVVDYHAGETPADRQETP